MLSLEEVLNQCMEEAQQEGQQFTLTIEQASPLFLYPFGNLAGDENLIPIEEVDGEAENQPDTGN